MSDKCTCGHVACVCRIRATHDKTCKLRVATCCAVPIECEAHGHDVCPICDPCTCATTTHEEKRRRFNLSCRSQGHRARSARAWAKKAKNRLPDETVKAATKRFMRCVVKKRYETEKDMQPNPGASTYSCPHCGGLHITSKKGK